jgi:hypothetical protein
VHVGKDARKDKERTGGRKKPPDKVATAPKKYADADQQRQKRDPECVCALEAPVGTDHTDLIAQKVSPDASRGETDQEVEESSRRSTHVT